MQRILNLADSVDFLRGRVEELGENGDLGVIAELNTETDATLGELGQQLYNLTDSDLASIGREAAQLMAALDSGNLSPDEMESYSAELQRILDLVTIADETLGEGNPITQKIADEMQGYDWEGDVTNIVDSMRSALDAAMPGVGNDASCGVGQGAAEYDFSGDTDAAADNLEGAYRGSMDSNSPAQRMVPLGNDVSAGVGQGMTEYDFTASTTGTANNLIGTLSAALYAQATVAVNSARNIGRAISTGLASGILSGQSLVIQSAAKVAQAAIRSAKNELDINSPSGVFRDEVGLMAVRGLGEGFLKGEREQAEVIRNAARYLTGEAKSSIVTGMSSTDNRRTYHQESSVHVTGNQFYVQDKVDAQSLMMELTSLLRRQQRSLGYESSMRR
ncbi:MAG: hypothetical protein E7337_08455 [Clostridiales bacterium]|nr:hypothetical protein [Clostridiales bacterium]